MTRRRGTFSLSILAKILTTKLDATAAESVAIGGPRGGNANARRCTVQGRSQTRTRSGWSAGANAEETDREERVGPRSVPGNILPSVGNPDSSLTRSRLTLRLFLGRRDCVAIRCRCEHFGILSTV